MRDALTTAAEIIGAVLVAVFGVLTGFSLGTTAGLLSLVLLGGWLMWCGVQFGRTVEVVVEPEDAE